LGRSRVDSKECLSVHIVFCFDAFSLREPVSTSLENALREKYPLLTA
jgi:hypothetical protein